MEQHVHLRMKMSFVDNFIKTKPEDNFCNLKKVEDLSTVYHGEYKSYSEGLDYWAKPPVGFSVDCDVLLGLFGENGAVVVACTQINNQWKVKLIKKNGKDMPKALVNGGFKFNVEYEDSDLPFLEALLS